MRYFAPRQRRKDNKWDYTCLHDDYVFPVGYCRAWQPPSSFLFGVTEAERLNDKEQPFVHKYHSHGHDSAEEAYDCYKQYILDHDLVITTDGDSKRRCVVCGIWTQTRAEIDSYMYVLCEQHANSQEVAKLFDMGDSIES
jgi:hypothetical protein